MTEDQARDLFRTHCSTGQQGALEAYGERPAIASIMAAHALMGATAQPAPAPQGEDGWSELERLARAATPGPWRWEVSLTSRHVALCGGPPKSGFGAFDHDVMSFKRWGLNNAAPVFWGWEGHFGTPKRADEVAVPVEGREHHAHWFRTIDDPNAAFIAAANPSTILKLIAAARSLPEGGEGS